MSVDRWLLGCHDRLVEFTDHHLLEEVLGVLEGSVGLEVIYYRKVVVYTCLCLRGSDLKNVVAVWDYLISFLLLEEGDFLPVHLHHQQGVVHHT